MDKKRLWFDLLNSGTSIDNNWYFYESPLAITTRYEGCAPISRTAGQVFPLSIYEDSEAFYLITGTEGDDVHPPPTEPLPTRGLNVDMTKTQVLLKSGLSSIGDLITLWPWWSDDLINNEPNISLGSNPDDQAEDSLQTYLWTAWEMTDGSYGGLYSGNAYPYGGAYHLFFCTSPAKPDSNALKLWTLGPKKITGTGNLTRLFGKVFKYTDDNYYLLLGEVTNATSTRTLSVDVWVSSTDISIPANQGGSWTQIHTDIFNGTGVEGLGNVSDIWMDGGKAYFYVATNTPRITGNGYYGNSSLGRLQDNLGISTSLYSINPITGLVSVEEDEFFTLDQQATYGLQIACGKKTFMGRDFFIVTGYKWGAQTYAAPLLEAKSRNNIIIKGPPIGGQVVGNHVYPSDISKFYKPTQSSISETTHNPIEVLGQTLGQIVGSPSPITSFCNMLKMDNGAYVEYSDSCVTDSKYFSVRVRVEYVGGSRLFCIARQEGSWEIWMNNDRIITKIYNTDFLYKEYITAPISAGFTHYFGGIDITNCFDVGFVWSNGTLTCLVDFTTDVPQTKTRDDQFTDIRINNNKVRQGELTSGTMPYFGPIIIWNGQSKATTSNWINCDLI